MVLQCADCKKSNFNTQRGLAGHRARCKFRKDEILSRQDHQIAAAFANVFKKKSRKQGTQGTPSLNQHIDLHAGASPSLSTTTVVNPPPSPSQAAPVPEPEGSTSRSRTGRLRTFPTRYKDFLPAQTIPLAHAPQPPPRSNPEVPEQPSDDPQAASVEQPPPERVSRSFTTRVNDAGVFRVYPNKPTSDPDSMIGLDDVCESPNFAACTTSRLDHNPLVANGILSPTEEHAFYAPFTSPSVYRLMSWFVTVSHSTSLTDIGSLVAEVICAADFNASDFVGFSATREAKRLDNYNNSLAASSESGPEGPERFSPSHGWSESSVSLALPCERQNLRSESRAPTTLVSGLFHREIVDIVTTAFRDPEVFPTLHLTPYREYHIASEESPPERVYSEMYSSDSFFDAWECIQDQGHISRDDLERVMVALMLWSDSTCLTNFGTASLWPVYLSLGNQSKYIRSRPSSFSHRHLAYMPSLPDDIQDAYMTIYQRAPSSATLTHLKRELIHAVYELILNSKLVDAYKEGLVITCYDGIQRRLFPRLLTYSGDYPEKQVAFGFPHAVLACVLIHIQSSACRHQVPGEVSMPAMSCHEN